jgi:DNA helicase IV
MRLNFHGLCEFVVSQTGGEFKPGREGLREFYDRISPQLLSDSIPRFPKRYDLIIVDEAQDFIEEWWYPIIDLQKSSRDSQFYLFRDPNQNIFLRQSGEPFDDGVVITLDVNYRNTPAIIQWLNRQCQANICISDHVEKGIEPVEVQVQSDQHEIIETEKVINRLVLKDKIDPHKIVILGKHSLKESSFGEFSKIGNFTIVEDYFIDPRQDTIRYLSVYRFKGLEADCVLFTGIGRPARADIREDPKAVLLTGASRAKKLLYLFYRKNINWGNC